MTRPRTAAAFVLAVFSVVGTVAGDEPKSKSEASLPAMPADFRLDASLFTVGPTPAATSQIIVRRGVAYQFVSDSPEEVQIIDVAASRVVLVDLKRKIQTEISSNHLDTHLGVTYNRILAVVRSREKSDKRADRLAAAMGRDLIEPKFKAAFDDAKKSLHLTNTTVEADATGEPETDQGRYTVIVNALAAIIKLSAIRDPDGIPPFPRLDALRILTVDHRLRPTEINFLYRLAGPPKRMRWTYALIPSLTDREIEAIARINNLRETAKFVAFADYEDDAEED
jgi:hypothetical protein